MEVKAETTIWLKDAMLIRRDDLGPCIRITELLSYFGSLWSRKTYSFPIRRTGTDCLETPMGWILHHPLC